MNLYTQYPKKITTAFMYKAVADGFTLILNATKLKTDTVYENFPIPHFASVMLKKQDEANSILSPFIAGK